MADLERQVNKRTAKILDDDIQSRTAARKIQLGLCLAHELASDFLNKTVDADLAMNITQDLHHEGKTYADVIREYFTNDERTIDQLMDSPFVRGIEAAGYYTDDDKEFLSRLDMSKADLIEWTEKRLNVLVDELQHAVLYGDLIEPVPLSVSHEKRDRGHEEWAKANPEKVREYQRLATQAASEAAVPRVLTEANLVIIQAYLDKGLSVNDARELLEMVGIKISDTPIYDAIRNGDLVYPYTDEKKTKIENERQGILAVFEMSEDRPQAYKVLRFFGISQGKADSILTKFKARKKIDWMQEIHDDGSRVYTLHDIVKHYSSQSYENSKLAYEDFKKYMSETFPNIQIPSYNLFHVKYYDVKRPKDRNK